MDDADNLIFDDTESEYGASTIANMGEAEGEKLGYSIWLKEESVSEMKARWITKILDIQQIQQEQPSNKKLVNVIKVGFVFGRAVL